MVARILLILALLLPFPAAAQAPAGKTLEGSWAMEVGGAAIFRFDIAPAAKKGEWRGTWNRPSSLASDGNRFAKLKGPPEQVKSMAGIEVEDQVELSFNDPRPGAIPDIFRFRLLTPDTAELVYVGTDLAPYTLKRVAPGARIGPWDESKVYARPVPAKAPPAAAPAETFNLPPGR
ncbi:hypothetical protein GRI75_11015 [Altererythrobacter soli]|uniref:Uncharacterized protein n=1 Tax=Croceibacterium soli TaxID=1739690 RepID=A0A6I4UTQ3_9SPHN|nr:hypothetical protein [Croceibacterium soli]MXP42171.1 hypothetical protein [Croceibacterium soli]